MKFSTPVKLSILCMALNATSLSLCALRVAVLPRNVLRLQAVRSVRASLVQQSARARCMPVRRLFSEQESLEHCPSCDVALGLIGGLIGSVGGSIVGEPLGFLVTLPAGKKKAKEAAEVASFIGIGCGGLGGPLGVVSYAGVSALVGAGAYSTSKKGK